MRGGGGGLFYPSLIMERDGLVLFRESGLFVWVMHRVSMRR